MLTELLLSLLGGLGTVVAGLVTSWLTQKRNRENASIDTLVEALLQDKVEEGEGATVRQEAQKAPGAPPSKKREPLVEGATKLVMDYHEQGLSQAAIQFWFSVIAAAIGFIWILYAGFQFRSEAPATALKALPGAAIDAVAALFFTQSAATRQRATELYDRLRKDKQIDDAIKLVDSIDDWRAKSAVRAQLALYLAGLTPGPLNLEYFIPSAGRAKKKLVDEDSTSEVQGDRGEDN